MRSTDTRLLAILRSISTWSNTARWRSWIVHGLIAFPLLLLAVGVNVVLWLFGLFNPVTAAAAGVVEFWFIREGEQYVHRRFGGIPTYWTDVVMDIVSPTSMTAAGAAFLLRVARALLLLAVLVAMPAPAAAQAPPLRKEPTFQMQHVAVDSTMYGQDLPIYLLPFHGVLLLTPASDSIVILNAVAFGPTMAPATGPACASALHRPAVLTARLVLGRPDSVWWHQDFIQRGQTRLFTRWEQPLPSGDTLRLMEVWRRGSDCAAHDGTLVVLFTIRRGARR